MNVPADRLAALSPEKRALLAQRLGQAAAPAAAAPAVAGQRIAIVAAACRLPGGADSPQAFWQLLAEGRDAVTPVPPERWDGEALFSEDADAPDRVRSRHGAFLAGIEQFDANFFGISPREAAAMDPQQRLLLELAWEALEAAGLPVERLAGSASGVFVGAHSHSSDWWLRQLAQRGGLDSHSATGSAHSILANRLSYVLDLRGPSMAVDTACSSSLVAVHLACQSLRSGECDLALAAGVNLMLGPAASIAFSRLQILSPHGRCRSFDAAADGIVRGEGAVLLVLKRLADAQRDGDPVLALIAGSAVNQDGASNGLTAPSGPAQEAVVSRALALAGLAPARVGLVETHGTGTPLGDPVEVEALARSVGAPAAQAPRCWLGALKTNIGHLEGAAGIAGLLKAVLCLREGRVPPNLHFSAPNPHLHLEATRFAIPTTLEPWPAGEQPRVAGVSSFGFGGTNAHAVLEEYRPAPADPATPPPGADWITVSARDRAALDAALRDTAALLRATDAATLPDLLHTARTRRSHHALRVAVHGTGPGELADRLAARIGQPAAPAEPGAKTVWVFSGQGGLTAGVARELYDGDADFRTALDAVAAPFLARAGWDLREPLLDAAQAERIATTEVAQPALFALQVALAAAWRARGLLPGAVVGHSVGEVAAAHAAGVLSLDDAVRVVHERSRAMQPALGRGRMAQIECAEAELAGLPAAGSVELAGLNGPRSCVVAGAPEAVEACVAQLAARGIRGRLLDMPYAFHSTQMAPFVPVIEAALAGLAPRAASVPLVSSVHGDWADTSRGDHGAPYWGRNVREPVRFAAASARLVEAGYRCFLEIGPHPALGAGLLATAEAAGVPIAVAGTLRRGQPATSTLLDGLCTLYEAGAAIAWPAAPGRRVVPLPPYPWQRQRHALDAPEASALARNVLGRAGEATTGAVSCHVMDWPPAPGRVPRGALPAAALAPLAAALQARAQASDHARALAGEADVARAIEARAAQLAQQALAGLGADAVLPRHRRLHQRLLGLAAKALPGTAALPPRVEAALLERCGAALADVLRGRADPLALLFPADERDSAADVYARTASARLYNGLAADAVREIARQAGRPLRVLEIGAGTGATTAPVLEALPAGGDYVFTDVSPLFVQDAEARFGAAPHGQRLRGRRLDIEADPATQGFAGERFDLVVATNVLHATADLRRSLVHARGLLAEGGVLLLIETVAQRAWTDLSFGLTEGWWRFADAPLRQTQALLDAPAWCRVLAETGFAAAQAVGAALSHDAVHPQALLLARAGDPPPPSARFAGRRFHVAGDAAGFGRRVGGALCAEGATLAEGSDDPTITDRLHTGALDVPRASDTTLERLPGALAAGIASALALAQQPGAGRLWFVTRGAQAVDPRDTLAPAAAPLWGLGRSIALEQPARWGGLVDLDPAAGDEANLAALLDALAATDGEDQVAIRAGAARVARLAPRPMPPRATLDLSQGSQLVTGGFGGLGPKIARWLAEQGARHIVLAGRRGAPAGDAAFEAALAPLRAQGIELVFERADVADHDAMARLFERQAAAGRPVRGVVHAAASIRFQALEALTPADLDDALRAKVLGAWVLHELMHELVHDGLFVLFSSATASFGAKGLAAYASANAFLAALAQHRAAAGLPATCIDWGAWEEIRLLGHAQQDEVARFGQRTMADDDAFASLAALVHAGVPAAMLADIDWPTACAAFQAHGRRPFLAAMEGGAAPLAAARAETAVAAAPEDLRTQLLPLAPHERLERVTALVRGEVARVLGLAGPQAVDPVRGLFEMGLDSLLAMQLQRRLAAATGLVLPATLAFNHPSVQPLAANLLERLALPAPAAEEEADTIDSLSDDEVRRALQAELAAAGLLDDTGGPR